MLPRHFPPLPAGGGLSLIAVAVLCVLLAPPAARAQLLPGSSDATPDSIAQRLGLPEGHTPNGALTRSLVVPGWGQYYNRQYWKVPVAVAGLGGVLYALIRNWNRYYLYRNAWRYRRTGGDFVAPLPLDEFFLPPPGASPDDAYQGEFGDGTKYEAAYRELLAEFGNSFGEELPRRVRDRRDQFRRWGEMAIVGTGLFWILQVADAYVSAHLLGFDVDDLSVHAAPVPGAPGHTGVTARLRLSF